MSVRSSSHRSSPRRGFSDYACVPAKNAAHPEAISDRQATMVEPFTIAANITAQLQPTAQILPRFTALARWG